MAQKSKFGMHTLAITAGHQVTGHAGTTAIDIAGASTEIEALQAPFNCEVVSIDKSDNTIVFQNTDSVILPVGTFENVCFRCTHMNDDKFNSIGFYQHKRFNQGDICYYEGTKGPATGNHIHIEFAVGTFDHFERLSSNQAERMVTNLDGSSGINNNSCSLYFPQAVFIDPTITTTVKSTDADSNYYTNQYVFTLLNGVNATNYYLSNFGTNITGVRKNLRMVLTGSAAAIRSDAYSSDYKIIVPNGNQISIDNFYSWEKQESDGSKYRWCWGTYNGITGAFQYDPAVMHPEGSVGSAMYPPIRMQLDSSSARIRISQVGDILTTVPTGESLLVEEFNDAIASDGYRWVRVQYTAGTSGITYTGWIQYDPSVMHPYTVGM